MNLFALIDCNNFYVSCERVFNPKLQNVPVIILSNNDGCVIARSDQAKELGIPMGIPFFKVKDLCKEKKIAVLSSNYALYGDMSRRVMTLLQSLLPEVEIYSVDEAFLKLNTESYIKDLETYFIEIRKTILGHIGIPTSIGIAPSKTLAKVANKIAKKERREGICILTCKEDWEPILAQLNLTDIWGISFRIEKKLISYGISNPLTLAKSPPKWIRQLFSVVMEKMIYELNGMACYGLEAIEPKKQIIASRSLGKASTHLQDILEAGSCHIARAFEKMREQHCVTKHLHVFLLTSPFAKDSSAHGSKSMEYIFLEPTEDTRLASAAVRVCLKKMFNPKHKYTKVGVVLFNLIPIKYIPVDFWLPQEKTEKSTKIMILLDKINQNYGKNTLFLAAQGIERHWEMKRHLKSPSYTTRWDELVRV